MKKNRFLKETMISWFIMTVTLTISLVLLFAAATGSPPSQHKFIVFGGLPILSGALIKGLLMLFKTP